MDRHGQAIVAQRDRLHIVVPTMSRPGGVFYLQRMIESLAEQLAPVDAEGLRVTIVDMDGPKRINRQLEEIRARISSFPFMLDIRDRISIDRDPVTRIPGRRECWESNVGRDFALCLYLGRVLSDCRYILRLEDDVLACRGYVPKIRQLAGDLLEGPDARPFLSLFSLEPRFCLGPRVGKYFSWGPALLFRNDAGLDGIIAFAHSMARKGREIDRALAGYCPAGRPGLVVYPSLFQHIGDVSSAGMPDWAGRRSPTYRPGDGPLDVAAVWFRTLYAMVRRDIRKYFVYADLPGPLRRPRDTLVQRYRRWKYRGIKRRAQPAISPRSRATRDDA